MLSHARHTECSDLNLNIRLIDPYSVLGAPLVTHPILSQSLRTNMCMYVVKAGPRSTQQVLPASNTEASKEHPTNPCSQLSSQWLPQGDVWVCQAQHHLDDSTLWCHLGPRFHTHLKGECTALVQLWLQGA